MKAGVVGDGKKRRAVDRALSVSVQQERTGGALRFLTLAAVLGLFVLIILGGVVRVTESGLGCPDWPFCHGRIIPPADSATLIEYSHRLLATVTGLMVLAVGAVVWKAYRWDRRLVGIVSLAVVLLLGQVVLGGATVRTELEPGLVMAHLAVAEALLACMIAAFVIAWRMAGPNSRLNRITGVRARRPVLIPIAVAGLYVLLLTGSYVQASGATVACGDTWPLCQGELFRGGELAIVHMLHRILSIPVGGVILASLVEAWRLSREQPSLRVAALVVGGLFVAQVLVGGVNVWLAFPETTNVLHLAIATAVWASLVMLAVLAYPFLNGVTERSDAA
ncbi:MAG: heme A synthase [Dehalococcoidia bacterium]